jgi:hypothetical protein
MSPSTTDLARVDWELSGGSWDIGEGEGEKENLLA